MIIPEKPHGKTILNIVLTLEAPNAKLPSLKLAGMDIKVSSVCLIIEGRIIKTKVKEPAKTLLPKPNKSKNISMPKSPKTIEGIPDKLSVNILIA